MADLTEFEAQANTAAADGIKFDPTKVAQFAVVPPGFTVENLERYQARPNRKTGNLSVVDVSSLGQYVQRHSEPGTAIHADYSKATMVAVIDGHDDGPGHGDHRVTFTAHTSDQLKAWLAINKKPMGQIAFGLFLEDRAVDVVQPDAATIMEMVMTFDATKKVTFRSAQRLHDGQRQFQYVEENETKGAVTLPDHAIILAPIYRGMEPQRIKFMIRYRIEDGSLQFTVQMHDQETVMRAAFDKCVDALRLGLTDEPVYVTG